MFKKLLLFALAVVLVLSLASCSDFQETIDDPDVRERTVTMLDALINNDFNTSYGLMNDVCTENEFQTFFIRSILYWKVLKAMN